MPYHQCYRFHAKAFGDNNGPGQIRHNKPLHRTPTPAFFPAFCFESFVPLTSNPPQIRGQLLIFIFFRSPWFLGTPFSFGHGFRLF